VPALRVTFVAPFGLRRKGTTRARVIPLAAALAAHGHRVRVVVPAWDCPEDWGRRDRLPGVDVVHLPGHVLRFPEWSPTLLAQVWRVAFASDPDVLHCFKPIGYSGAVAYAAALAARWTNRPRLVAVDTDDLEGRQGWSRRNDRPGWQIALIDLQERRTLRSAQLVTVASAYLRGRAIDWGCRRDQICYLPNGVRAPGESPAVALREMAPEPGLVLYTRFNEFTPERGVQLIDRVLSESPGARLTVIGDGGDRARFEALIRSHHWANRVRLLGFQEADSLQALLRSPNVALWPFDDNPMNRARSPSKLLELLAYGRAVVAEDVGDVRRLVGSAGRLVPSGDISGFANAVKDLLEDERAGSCLGARAARRAAAELSWDNRAAHLESCYQNYT
jgi:glycosyltransferase involved in cell wall biosynthesis